MHCIVAVDERWGIGANGEMLVSNPEDMALFRRMTQGKAVVMGRATLLSLPGGRPLKNRENIVLSRDENFCVEGARMCRTQSALTRELKGRAVDEVFVIGGESVYTSLLPFCTRAYVTRFTAPGLPAPDRFFPNLDDAPGWRLIGRGDERALGDIRFAFCVYENAAPRPFE